jgi:hypothetical protein
MAETDSLNRLCRPPLRKGQTEQLLAAAVADNDGEAAFDVVSSNHMTYNSSQKALGLKDFTKIPPGTDFKHFLLGRKVFRQIITRILRKKFQPICTVYREFFLSIINTKWRVCVKEPYIYFIPSCIFDPFKVLPVNYGSN